MSNFSNEVCPDLAESIYSRQCWDLLLPESPIYLDIIYYVYSLAWTIDIFREFGTLFLILFTKNSNGISCKAQIMYVLGGMCRFSNDFEANEWIFFFPTYSYVVFAFGLLIAAFTFRSREDEEYDDQSLPLLVFGCIAATLMRGDEHLSMSLVHLRLMLEAAAIFAQSSLSQKKGAESQSVIFFLNSWFYGKILMDIYYTLVGLVSGYRASVTNDEGFRLFGNRSYSNTYMTLVGEMVLLYHLLSMRQVRKKKLEKPKKFEQLVMCRSDQ